MSIISLAQKSFGLDISERAFRAVQLKKIGSQIKLVSYHELPVAKGIIKEGKIVAKDHALELLKQLLHEVKGQKIFTKMVTACLPEEKTFIKLIKLAYPEGKNLLEEIAEEAKKHIPYALADVYLDWQYVDKRDLSQILIGVCPKEIVENYQEFLIAAKLIPQALEIEPTAVTRSLFSLKDKSTEPLMILDLGNSRSNLIIYANGVIPFTLPLDFSSDDLKENLKKQLKLTETEADLALSACGFDASKAQGYLTKLLEPEIKKLGQHIREAKYFYQEHFHETAEIKELYLTGSGSVMPSLSRSLEPEVKTPVKEGNPLINLNLGHLNLEPGASQSYNTAIGLALRSFLS